MSPNIRIPQWSVPLLVLSLMLLVWTTMSALTSAPVKAAPPQSPSAACAHTPEAGGPADGIRIMDTGNNRVQTLNGNSGAFGAPFGSAGSGNSQFNGAGGIAYAPWATTYVADTGNNRVQLFDRGGGFVMAFGSAGSGNGQFNAPRGIAVNNMGNIYVLDTGNNRVQVFAGNGTYQSQWGSAGSGNGQFNAPRGIAVNWSDGSVFVADTGNNRVQKFTGAGIFVTAWGAAGAANGQFNAPAALALNPLNGDVYVADTGNNRVQQFGGGGAYVRQWGGFNAPRGIAVGARNGVFVMDSNNNQIKRFGYDGSAQGAFGSGGSGSGQFSGATHIAADLGGVNLDQCYAADFFIAPGQKRRITVFYTLNNGLPANRFNNNSDGSGNNIYAKKVADWTQIAWQTYYDYNFTEPVYLYSGVDLGGVTGKEQEVQAFDIGRIGLDGWCCGWNHYEINSAYIVAQIDSGEDRGVGEVAIHEMFHNVQRGEFTNAEPGWASEGGAGNAQDKIVTRIDTNGGSRYTGLVNDFLVNRSTKAFRNVAYPFALFWTYFEEQLGGASPPEPGYGMSAMRQYVETTRVGSIHGIEAVNSQILALSGGTRNFESFWTDFTVANYTKRIGGAGARYSYLDEGATPYRSVPVSVQSLSTVLTYTQAISAYSAYYAEVIPNALSCQYVTFDLRSDVRVGFTLADHRAGALVRAPETFFGNRRIITLRNTGSYLSGDGMGVIVTGLANQASFTLGVRCVNPIVTIVRPNTVQKGMAGPAATDNPGAFVSYVSVSADGGPVRGLLYSQFSSQVGGITATLTTGSDLEDLFALVIAAPRQETVGDYDLRVTLDNTIAATQTLAVRYSSDTDENMLVIDQSGSMSDAGKMQAAKDAAQLQITEMDSFARGGLVKFDTTATLVMSLTDITVDPARTDLRNAVNALAPTGLTAIVSGINKGLDNLDLRGDPANSCGITLLTDGMDNQSTLIQRNNLIARLQTYPRPCPIYAIALGPDADKTFLQQFADASGGIVYAATLTTPTTLLNALGSSPAAPANGGPLTASWQNRLASIYDDIAARQAGRQRIFVGATRSAGTPPPEVIPVDTSVTEVVFALNGTNGYDKGVGLYDPDGILVTLGYPDAKIYDRPPLHWVIRVGAPKHGNWKIVFTEQGAAGGYIAMTSGITPIALEVFARAPESVPHAGHRVPIVGVLHNATQTLPGASVLADVQSAQGDVWHLRLFDDGNHGDGRAGDGVYGNWFTHATSAPCHSDTEDVIPPQNICDNAYQVYAVATLGDLRREAQTGFALEAGLDFDQDGIPDEWERANDLDPHDFADGMLDPDGDHLTNLDEFLAGTMPYNADTDGGGENDGSEVRHARDPLDTTDDALVPIYHLHPRPYDGYIVLQYTESQLFDHFQIFRRLIPPAALGPLAATDWLTVTAQAGAGGVYTDTQLTNGETYQYRVIGIGKNGEESTVLESATATPNTLTDPPNGMVHINNGAGSTRDRHVMLTFFWESSATQMRFGNSPDLSGRPWHPVTSALAWDLDPDVPVGGTAFVYVEFRDPYGNISDHIDPASILIAHTLNLPLIAR